MANLSRNFIAGRMNKMVDERLVPNGEYINALNIRMGSTEGSEIGVVENTKGNSLLTNLQFEGNNIGPSARCIGAFDDGAEETLYWFVHVPNYEGPGSPTGKIDLVVSFDTKTSVTTYHLISINDGLGFDTTLNFDGKHLITGVNKVEDLLYWTDNYNQPRQINVRRNYANPTGGIDGFSEEAILVIKKPPINSPAIKPISTSSQDNFLEDRFICFAYRYRYEDGEYSATSQFSKPSFIPNVFTYNTSTALNSGMLNVTNQCKITYNSGGPLVKSVDLLFKDMNNSIIRVIEKLNKSQLGIADYTEYTYNFENNKIFTILPESEILRLYDNVPRLAQAQTMMGNRLIYGNYLEGYDLKDINGLATKLEYFVTAAAEDIGLSRLPYTFTSGNYSWNGAQVIPQAIINIDLTGKVLVAGGIINALIRFKHASWSGDTPPPTEITAEETIDFTYILPQDFTSVYQLATSVDFTESIGTALNIQPVASCAAGNTLTDKFNCIVPFDLSGLFKYASGISTAGRPIAIISTPSSQVIGLQLPAMQYVDDPTGAAITKTVYEYYSASIADISYQEIGDPSSLHSNRGYEIGIVYMDEFNRATTALVSPNNTVHIPCGNSSTKNTITVNIPTQQIAPLWATRYKFVIKPDKEDYDVVYSNLFFRDPTSGADFFLLDGQNSTKVQLGDELIVKTDTQGPRGTCTWTTVLEKEAQQRDFLGTDNPPLDSQGNTIPIPAGTYMKLRANNFSTEIGHLPVVAYGEVSSKGSGCRLVNYNVDAEDPAALGTFIDYDIPAGSRINIKVVNYRQGNEGALFGNVGQREWKVDATFTSPQDYSNFQSWFDGSNISTALEQQSTEVGGVTGPNYNPLACSLEPCSTGKVASTFCVVNGRKVMQWRSSEGYSGGRKNAEIKVTIEVIRSAQTLIFESDPADAQPDLWYESTQSFAINALGEHTGNVQSQNFTTGAPALILTDFFNCYSFGNGAESYKIQDSVVGKTLELGNRATTTKSIIYGAEERRADLTYSGVFNDESNINKLNEFNAGLLNFKALEESFGPVMKLFARETDVLVLQEDKISYVLAGKNLLSDAGGGSTLTSVPEVLGTQLARIEEFGISHNPESFSQWGADKYFTDAKRGAVILLKGAGAQSDQLKVVSREGMRTWFRDLFNTSFETQKLGGFDPYMNEYVLSANDIQLPQVQVCKECGVTETVLSVVGTPYQICYNVGDLIGDININYIAADVSGTFVVSAVYNGVVYTTGSQTTSGTLTFPKNSVSEEEVVVTISSSGSATISFTVGCPEAETISIVLVQVSSSNETGKQIHNQYRWSDGTFVSPLHSEQVVFQSGTFPIVSLYTMISGQQGGGTIPSNTAVITMLSNKFGADDFDFDINSDKLKYLRSNTLYQNTSSDITALINNSVVASPINPPLSGNTAYNAQFNMPNTGQFLYMLWDYRNSTPADLCFGLSFTSACCACEASTSIYKIQDCITGQFYEVDDATGIFSIGQTVQYVQGTGAGAGTFVYCGTIVDFGTTPNATLFSNTTQVCGNAVNCNFESATDCTEYTIATSSGTGIGYTYTDCDGNFVQGYIGGASGHDAETFCAQTGSVDTSASVSNNGTCNY
tara:strand:+ start:3591 stop:8408 length:4818 start_codon:yes stop_codon:yes gene_type:complete